jgi:hypothetical protein
MKKNIIISIFNSFYYVLFVIVFLFFNYEDSSGFYVGAALFMLGATYPIIKWIIGVYQHVFIRSYFSKYDFFYKFLPFILLAICYYLKNNEAFSFIIPYILLFSFILFIIPIFVNHMNLMFVIPLKFLKNHFSMNNSVTIPFIMGLNWKSLNTFIQQFTNVSYYVIDDCKLDRDILNIYSCGRQILLNHEKNYFILDGIVINYATAISVQEEYKCKLFEMTDEELELMKMLAI